jgi:hypothetical protein
MDARYEGPTLSRFLSEDPEFITIGIGQHTQQLLEHPQLQNTNGTTPSGLNSASASSLSGAMQAGGKSTSGWGSYLLDPQAQNAYSYGRNNPLRFTDPTGKWYVEIAASFSPPPPFFVSASTGVRVDNTGITWFASGGPSIGMAFPVQASFSSGNLSHTPQFSVTRDAEFMMGSGIGVSSDGVFNPRRPLGSGNNPSTSYSAIIGLGGGVSQQYTYSTPIYSFAPKTSSPSSGGGNGTFTFGGFTYPKLFSGITTNGGYARQ